MSKRNIFICILIIILISIIVICKINLKNGNNKNDVLKEENMVTVLKESEERFMVIDQNNTIIYDGFDRGEAEIYLKDPSYDPKLPEF